jgi:hypothetical protein
MTDCSTSNIEQTLFLGCSIERFSCNLGFNEQPTEVNVRIAKDTCASPDGTHKVYYDPTSTSIEKQWTAADPGLYCYGPSSNEPPRLGAPVYFRFGDFEFMGLLQSWVKVNTKSDTDVYDVKLVSPVEILEGCQIIVSDYTGPIKGFNLFNVYGFQEVFSPHTPAPPYTDPRYPVDGPIMGSFSEAFGGANANKVGMTWNKVKDGIQILTSSLIPSSTLNYEEFSEVGRIVFYGGQLNCRFGLIPYDEKNISLGLAFNVSADLAYYILDISELPEVPDSYRIAGPSISLLSLISQVCNDFGMDYYIELVPVRQGNSILKIIKVRTILRNIQPDTTIVQSYIDATPEVIDSSFGRELRNENTTTFLIGGQKQNIWQVDNGLPDPADDPEETWLHTNYLGEVYVRDRIVPYFGQDTSGNVYILHTTSGSHLENFHLVSDLINNPNAYYINFDLRNRHAWILLDSVLPNLLPVTVGEMRAAAAGYDAWAWHSRVANTAFNQYITESNLDIDTIFNTDSSNPILNAVFEQRGISVIPARDLANLQAKPVSDQFLNELRQYVQTIGNIYTQSRRTFMVRTPWIKARYSVDRETIASSFADLDVQYTDESCDGGWTEAENVLYLANPSTYLDRMRQQDATIKSFGMFDLPNLLSCEVISGGTQVEYSDGSFRTETKIVDTVCQSVSQTSQTISEFDTPESFAVDRTLFPGITGEGKVLYYACTQELQPIFLDRINLISPRILVQFSQPLDFWTDTPNGLFNANGWDFNSPYLDQGVSNTITDSVLGSAEKELLIHKASPPLREPDAIAIALKSNVHTYGPWKPDNIIEAGPPGQIKVEKQDDLVPWTYGSYEALNEIGQLRADESVTVMTEGEVGNITIHGVPDIPLGAELASLKGLTSTFFNNNEHLIENRFPSFSTATLTDVDGRTTSFNIPGIDFGTWNGSFGPTVTSINIDFGPDGITTNYGFRTFTPKFGILSKLNAQRLEHRYIFENHRRAQLRFIEESRKVQQKYLQSLRQIQNAADNAVGDRLAHAGTPHSVLIGQSLQWPTLSGDIVRRPIVATKDLHELQNNMVYTGTGEGSVHPFDSMAIMSLDGLVRPVSMTGGGGLPPFAHIGDRYDQGYSRSSGLPINYEHSPFFEEDGNNRGNTASPISPYLAFTGFTGLPSGNANFKTMFGFLAVHQIYNYIRTTDYLNPLSNPSGFGHSTISTLHTGAAGHDIDILARNKLNNFTGDTSSLILPIDSGGAISGGYADDYRFLALRGPLMMQGWGYDTNGKPIPNDCDVEVDASGGVFNNESLTDYFLPDFLKKPHTWPVAPIDLRFDRRRGVWTVPPQYPIIEATLFNNTGDLSIGNGSLTVTMTGDPVNRPSCWPIGNYCSGLIFSDTPTFDELTWDATGTLMGWGVIPIKMPSHFAENNAVYSSNLYFIGDKVQCYYSVNDGYYHILDTPPHNPWYISVGFCNRSFSGTECQLVYCSVYNPVCIGPPCNFDGCPQFGSFGVTAKLGGAPGISGLASGDNVLILHDRPFNACGGTSFDETNIWAFPMGGGGTTTTSNNSGCCDLSDIPVGAAPNGIVGVQGGNITAIKTIVRGIVVSDSVGGTYQLGTLVKMAGSADPTTDPITVTNIFDKRFFAGDKAYAIAREGSNVWDDLGEERPFALFYGKPKTTNVATGTTTFTLDHTTFHPLEQNVSTPTVDVTVINSYNKSYTTNDYIVVAWDEDATVAAGNSRFSIVGEKKDSLLIKGNPDATVNGGNFTLNNVRSLGENTFKPGDHTTIINTYSKSYVTTDTIIAAFDPTIPGWTDITPNSVRYNSVHFKLKVDKKKEDSSVIARQIESAATDEVDITVYDPFNKYYGYSGFQGHAVPVYYNSTLRYEISEMEGPAQFVIANLGGTVTAGGSANSTYLTGFGPDNNAQVPLTVSSNTVKITGGAWQGSSLSSNTKVLATLLYTGGNLNTATYKVIVPLGAASSDTTMVFIDQDINRIVEYTGFEGSKNDWGYIRTVVDLKYYIVDPNDSTRMILATGSDGEYLTKSIYYDDGDDLTLGDYTRQDFPNYGENSPWPPDGFDLTKKYRGIALNNVLVTRMCQPVEPPDLIG